ncbi:MAG: hypothetical protein K6F84_06280 [Lachnospiraceae bacterium]|nr:hypothetical protein [Lachnospiraceae bacterium]
MGKIYYHLPGLFEFYEFYKVFLEVFRNHREYFYDWCEIGSVYGAPADCIWGGGRVGYSDANPFDVLALMKEHNISARLTFSNSKLTEENLGDKKCNELCKIFEEGSRNGIIIYSDLLVEYIRKKYPGFYFVSSTTKVITDFREFRRELNREEFAYTVLDFRLNKRLEELSQLDEKERKKTEFLCNECCDFGCLQRKACYENVSLKCLGLPCEDHICPSIDASKGYRFSLAMENPGFISLKDITDVYAPMGFENFKLEGRSLGSAVVLEMLLYYMTKPEYFLKVREEIYLDNMLDLF